MKTMFPLVAAMRVAMPLAASARPTIDPVPHPASGSESFLRANLDLRWRGLAGLPFAAEAAPTTNSGW